MCHHNVEWSLLRNTAPVLSRAVTFIFTWTVAIANATAPLIDSAAKFYPSLSLALLSLSLLADCQWNKFYYCYLFDSIQCYWLLSCRHFYRTV